MTRFFVIISVFLLANILVGLIRLMRGPGNADRMLAVQLFGTTGVAILLILGTILEEPVVYNVSLIFVLLATLAILTFKKRYMAQEKARAAGGDY
jgi:multicomponent Na+:H+ antiporter subunit F